MNRSELDRLVDEIIGEAVLSLLREQGPINTQALILRLRSMHAHESDSQRREAITQIIAEVKDAKTPFGHRTTSYESGRKPGSKRGNNDNVYPLFGNGESNDSKKIH